MIFDLPSFEVESVPSSNVDIDELIQIIGKNSFALIYDVLSKSTKTIINSTESDTIAERVCKSIPGLVLRRSTNYSDGKLNEITALNIYRKRDRTASIPFSDIFRLSYNSSLGILFAPVDYKDIQSYKSKIERFLSSKPVRKTISGRDTYWLGGFSYQLEHLESSEEISFYSDLLDALNKSILTNGLAYKIFAFSFDKSKEIEEYIDNRFFITDKFTIRATKLSDAFKVISKNKAAILGSDFIKSFIAFHGSSKINYNLRTTMPISEEHGITFGKFMEEGVYETDTDLRLNPSSLNLGIIITGLPGSGKSSEAMAIIDSLLSNYRSNSSSECYESKPKLVIISPTDEWNLFASQHNMRNIKMFSDKLPINFFKCPANVPIDKFYEDLATLLSSASNAGPYRNPMEKCMLNAFRKIYKNSVQPDPIEVYNQIEDSIIKFHAKKSTNGITYTKHGENIRSALENIRSILTREEYAATHGIVFESLMEEGTVFDMSNISLRTKAYLYSLVMNQIYAIASTYNTSGDSKIRLVICIEEAQLIFGSKDSAAVEDLKHRIQDFRKQGISMMLLLHNVGDIDPSIRRLFQIKIYLKQAADVAELAAKDLIFSYAKEEDIVIKLRHLETRVGAISYVVKNGMNKISPDTIFIRTKYYGSASNPAEKISYSDSNNLLLPPKMVISQISINCSEAYIQDMNRDYRKQIVNAKIFFLGEEISEHSIMEVPTSFKQEMMEEKDYTIQLLDKRRREVYRSYIRASENIEIILN